MMQELTKKLDYYRNSYQLAELDNKELKKELAEFETLNTMQSDMIRSLNKRIETLNFTIKKLKEMNDFIIKKDE